MTSAGRLALVGSGEYLPALHDVEAWLLEGRPRRYVQLATAAAPEGESTLRYWHDLGAQAAARLDAEQIVVDVRTRSDADEQRWVDAIAGAGLIYLSGGNPVFLATTLAGTRVWAAIRDAWRGGASLAGCSAGAMALAGQVPDFRHPRRGGTVGLGVVPDVKVLPHFDRYTKWMPAVALRPLVATGAMVLGIDEDTALVAEPSDDARWQFSIRGRQSAWIVDAEGKRPIDAGVLLHVDQG